MIIIIVMIIIIIMIPITIIIITHMVFIRKAPAAAPAKPSKPSADFDAELEGWEVSVAAAYCLRYSCSCSPALV